MSVVAAISKEPLVPRLGDDQRRDSYREEVRATVNRPSSLGGRTERKRRPDQVQPVFGPEAVARSGLPERVDAEDLDLRPDDGLAAGLDDAAANDPFGPELERDRRPLILGRELDPGQAMALRERDDVPRIDALARLGDMRERPARGRPGTGIGPPRRSSVSIKVS